MKKDKQRPGNDKPKLSLIVFFSFVQLFAAIAFGLALFFTAAVKGSANGIIDWKNFPWKTLTLDLETLKTLFTTGIPLTIKTFTIPLGWIAFVSVIVLGVMWLSAIITMFAGRWENKWCKSRSISLAIFSILIPIGLFSMIFGFAGLKQVKGKRKNRNKNLSNNGQPMMNQQFYSQQGQFGQQPNQQFGPQPMGPQPFGPQPMGPQPFFQPMMNPMATNGQFIPFYIPIEYINSFRIAPLGQNAQGAPEQPKTNNEDDNFGSSWSFDEF